MQTTDNQVEKASPWPIGDRAELINALKHGRLDPELSEIIDTINVRTHVIARLRAQSALDKLSLHARVRFDDRVKPQYLRGVTGEIHEFCDNIVVVCLDEPLGKFKSGHVRCSPEMLDLIQET